MIRIQFEKSAMDSAAQAAYWSIKKFYEDEENQKKFEEWKAKREK